LLLLAIALGMIAMSIPGPWDAEIGRVASPVRREAAAE
jgi:HAMP domain-containing protein